MNTIRLLRPNFIVSLTLALLLTPASLLAQDQNGLDVTMRMVIDDEDLSDGLVQELQLPDPSEAGRNDSGGGGGPEKAEDMRGEGRALGREISEEARSRREDRPGDRPGRPDGPFRDEAGNGRPEPGMGPGVRPDVPDQGARP